MLSIPIAPSSPSQAFLPLLWTDKLSVQRQDHSNPLLHGSNQKYEYMIN